MSSPLTRDTGTAETRQRLRGGCASLHLPVIGELALSSLADVLSQTSRAGAKWEASRMVYRHEA